MLLAYMDDSGEAGVQLWAAVVVDDADWLATLDAWTDYRRWLKKNFGFPISKGIGKRMPVELHATDFYTGAGDWRHLPVDRAARLRAMRVGLRLIGRHTRVFAVAWVPSRVKTTAPPTVPLKPALECWRALLERLRSYSTYSAGGARVITFLDQGYGPQFTAALRKMRRFHYVGSLYGGSLSATAPMILDDPVVRDSKQSQFVQMADLCAYAALRELRPLGLASGLWDELGTGIVKAVNMYTTGQPPGVKLLPP